LRSAGSWLAFHAGIQKRDYRTTESDLTTGRDAVITSLQNPILKRLRALESDRALREREGLYLAWGLHLAQEAIASRVPIAQALAGDPLARTAEGRGLLKTLQSIRAPIVRVSDKAIESVVPGSSDQGILLIIRRPRIDLTAVLGGQPSLLLAAHGVQDPGNLGSMIRSARAFGATAVIVLPGSADPFGSRAVRAAMGAPFTLPIVEASVPETLDRLRAAGLAIVAADAEGDRQPAELDLRRPAAIVVGNEGAGLPREILQAATARVRIPMAPGAESLNVHAASVALLYEAARQRSFSGLR